MKLFKYLLVVVLLAAGPVYLVAKDSSVEVPLKKAGKLVGKKTTPVAISDKEKTVIQRLKSLKKALPDSIRDELAEYTKDKLRLRMQNKKIFSSLSDGARQALKDQRKIKKELSPKVRRIADQEAEAK